MGRGLEWDALRVCTHVCVCVCAPEVTASRWGIMGDKNGYGGGVSRSPPHFRTSAPLKGRHRCAPEVTASRRGLEWDALRVCTHVCVCVCVCITLHGGGFSLQ